VCVIVESEELASGRTQSLALRLRHDRDGEGWKDWRGESEEGEPPPPGAPSLAPNPPSSRSGSWVAMASDYGGTREAGETAWGREV
jgi:hypothetical protein